MDPNSFAVFLRSQSLGYYEIKIANMKTQQTLEKHRYSNVQFGNGQHGQWLYLLVVIPIGTDNARQGHFTNLLQLPCGKGMLHMAILVPVSITICYVVKW